MVTWLLHFPRKCSLCLAAPLGPAVPSSPASRPGAPEAQEAALKTREAPAAREAPSSLRGLLLLASAFRLQKPRDHCFASVPAKPLQMSLPNTGFLHPRADPGSCRAPLRPRERLVPGCWLCLASGGQAVFYRNHGSRDDPARRDQGNWQS